MVSFRWKPLFWLFVTAMVIWAIQAFYASFWSSTRDAEVAQADIVDYRELDVAAIQLAPGVHKGQMIDASSLERQGWHGSYGAFISREHNALLILQDYRVGQICSFRLRYKNQAFGRDVWVSELVSSLGYPHRLVPTLNGVKLIYFVGKGSDVILEVSCSGKNWSKLKTRSYRLGGVELARDLR